MRTKGERIERPDMGRGGKLRSPYTILLRWVNAHRRQQISISACPDSERGRAQIPPEDPREVILVLKSQSVADFLDRDFRLPQNTSGLVHFEMGECTSRRSAHHFLTALGQGADAHSRFFGNRHRGKIFRKMMLEQPPQVWSLSNTLKSLFALWFNKGASRVKGRPLFGPDRAAAG